jgi:hypothetical protein
MLITTRWPDSSKVTFSDVRHVGGASGGKTLQYYVLSPDVIHSVV